MYLIDTSVVSETRKRAQMDVGLAAFFRKSAETRQQLFISTITLGELRRGVLIAGRRGEVAFADALNHWLEEILTAYHHAILPFDAEAAHVWARMRMTDPHAVLDKQIAAIAVVNGLTLVTRNLRDFANLGAPLLNPFVSGQA